MDFRYNFLLLRLFDRDAHKVRDFLGEGQGFVLLPGVKGFQGGGVEGNTRDLVLADQFEVPDAFFVQASSEHIEFQVFVDQEDLEILKALFPPLAAADGMTFIDHRAVDLSQREGFMGAEERKQGEQGHSAHEKEAAGECAFVNNGVGQRENNEQIKSPDQAAEGQAQHDAVGPIVPEHHQVLGFFFEEQIVDVVFR